MIGPISFLVGLGLLGGAGISKMLDSSRINAEKAYCSTHLNSYEEEELKKAMGGISVFNGFRRFKIAQEIGDPAEANELLRVWILRELGYKAPIEGEEKMEKYFYSGEYISPLYSAALYIRNNKFDLTCELIKDINETMENRLNKPFGDTYEDTKKRTLLWRKAELLGELDVVNASPYYNARDGGVSYKRTKGGEYLRTICKNGFLPHELKYEKPIYDEISDILTVHDIILSFIRLNQLANYIQKKDIDKCFSYNKPQYDIKPDKEALKKLFNCHANIHEESKFGLHFDYDEKEIQLIKSEDELKEFWSKNKYLQYQKKEKEICFEFAEKYDLSYFDLDKYDVAEYCCDGVGIRYTNISRYNGTDIKQLKDFEEKLREKRTKILTTNSDFLQDYAYCALYNSYDYYNKERRKNGSFAATRRIGDVYYSDGYCRRAKEELESWFGVSDELKEKERIEQEYQSHFDLKEK